MPNHQFTPEQEQAFGAIVCAHIGGHFQSGLWNHADPYIYVKMGPNLPAYCYVVAADGTVVKDLDDWDGK